MKRKHIPDKQIGGKNEKRVYSNDKLHLFQRTKSPSPEFIGDKGAEGSKQKKRPPQMGSPFRLHGSTSRSRTKSKLGKKRKTEDRN